MTARRRVVVPTTLVRCAARRDRLVFSRAPPDAQKETMDTLTPKDHGEALALYRAQIVGAVASRDLDRGDLREALLDLSKQRFRPPRSHGTRTYSLSTLERWYYAYKMGGLDALRPAPRSDKGRARELTDEQRQLLLDIRKEHPSASVPLILETLVADGRLEKDAVSETTVRRLYVEHGLDRTAQRQGGQVSVVAKMEGAPSEIFEGRTAS